MKFVYAPLGIREIERRVREEEKRTKRKVTEVLLTPAEWIEFLSQREIKHHHMMSYGQYSRDRFEFAPRVPMSPRFEDHYEVEDIYKIIVRPDTK